MFKVKNKDTRIMPVFPLLYLNNAGMAILCRSMVTHVNIAKSLDAGVTNHAHLRVVKMNSKKDENEVNRVLNETIKNVV